MSQQSTFSLCSGALIGERQGQEEDPYAAISHSLALSRPLTFSFVPCPPPLISLPADPLPWTDVLRRACSPLYLAAMLSPFYL